MQSRQESRADIAKKAGPEGPEEEERTVWRSWSGPTLDWRGCRPGDIQYCAFWVQYASICCTSGAGSGT